MAVSRQLVQDLLTARGLGTREAARQMGVSNATVWRYLKGEAIDVASLVKISAWTNIPLRLLIDEIDPLEGQAVEKKIAMLVEKEPRLKKLFEDAFRALEGGEVSVSDVEDIVAYATFKLRSTGELNAGKSSQIGFTDEGG